MGILRWWLKHGPGSPGATAKAMAKSYSRHYRLQPEAPHHELMRAALAQRYAVIGRVPPALQNLMVINAKGDMIQLMVSIVQTENPKGMEGAQRSISLYGEMVAAIEETLEKHLPKGVGPKGPRASGNQRDTGL